MNPEILKRVRAIELTSRKLMDEVLSGQYRSHFKGQGVQFSEHRVYVPGDDVRHIDWKVSARTREPLLRKYEEERELSVLLVVDCSASHSFGTKEKFKSELSAEISGLLAFAAMRSGDRVGLLTFGSEVIRVLPPKRGKAHGLRIIKEVLEESPLAKDDPRTRGTQLAEALETAGRVLKHAGILFLVSDLVIDEAESEAAAKQLRRLGTRHDGVLFQVYDPRERQLPSIGRLLVSDPETGVTQWIDTGSYHFQKWLETQSSHTAREIHDLARTGVIEKLVVSSHEDYLEAVAKFFQLRARALVRRGVAQ